MYFAHISIGGGIVGVETVISTFDNICSSLKKKNIQQNFKGKKFSFAIVDTKPENIPGGIAYGFKASQYGYFNNPLRLSPDHLKRWISLKDNKKKIVHYLKFIKETEIYGTLLSKSFSKFLDGGKITFFVKKNEKI